MSESPIDEIRALREDVNALKYLFEGDDYRPGLRADIHEMAADVRAMKEERSARRHRSQAARGTAVLAMLLVPVVAVVHQYLVISDYRHRLGWPPAVALALGAVADVLLVMLVTVAVVMWFWWR